MSDNINPIISPIIAPIIGSIIRPVIGSVGDDPSFYAPLVSDLLLVYGTGTATFTRSTTGTVKDYQDNVVTCAINEARFQGARRISEGVWSDKDPGGSTLTTLEGILIEEERENELTYSEAIDNATGGWVESNITATLNNASSPDTLTTATKIVPDTGTGTRGFNKTISTLSDNVNTSASIFIKKIDYQWCRLLTRSKNNTLVATYFDLVNGTVGTAGHSSYKIEEFNNDWYRVSVVFDSESGATSPSMFIRLADGDNDSNATGDGSKYNLFWGTQVEEGNFTTSYIKTVASTVTRTRDTLTYPSDLNIKPNTGTIICDYRILGIDPSTAPAMVSVSDTGTTNYISLWGSNTTFKQRLTLVSGGVTEASIDAGNNTVVPNTHQSVGTTYTIDDVDLFLDGALVGSDTSADMPLAFDIIRIGDSGAGIAFFNGTIKEVTIYKKKLDDAAAKTATVWNPWDTWGS